MKNTILRPLFLLALLLLASSSVGCASGGATFFSYAGTATTKDGKYAVVARNDNILFGALRKVYVCEITADGGLTNCNDQQSP